jgi:hypothetical protein
MSANNISVHALLKKNALCTWHFRCGTPKTILTTGLPCFIKGDIPVAPPGPHLNDSQKDLVEQAVQLPHIEGGKKPPW